jgi:hypothetical protein
VNDADIRTCFRALSKWAAEHGRVDALACERAVTHTVEALQHQFSSSAHKAAKLRQRVVNAALDTTAFTPWPENVLTNTVQADPIHHRACGCQVASDQLRSDTKRAKRADKAMIAPPRWCC